MKAKFIDENLIVTDRSIRNGDGTMFALASEMEDGYMEFVPASFPDVAQGAFPRTRYEVVDGVIYQRWENDVI